MYIGIPAFYHAVGPDHPNPASPGTWNTDGAQRLIDLVVPTLPDNAAPRAGFHLIKLVTSRDLTNWTYVGNRSVFIEPSHVESGAYDTTQMLGPSDVIVRGDELWMFYTGIKYR